MGTFLLSCVSNVAGPGPFALEGCAISTCSCGHSVPCNIHATMRTSHPVHGLPGRGVLCIYRCRHSTEGSGPQGARPGLTRVRGHQTGALDSQME